MAGTPLLVGCPSTFSTFMMSCEKMEKKRFSISEVPGVEHLSLALDIQQSTTKLVALSDTQLLSDGIDTSVRNFFLKRSPAPAKHTEFVTQCKRQHPHVASFGFIQVHAGPFRVHSGSLRVIHLWVNCSRKTYRIVHRRRWRNLCRWCPHC